MGEQAVSLCKKLGYYSAGTVEFLVDQNRNFYFLEMNTRLQVEHPITECITGVDLVQQMLRVAKGHKLNISQNDIKINGWAMESRVYAEDPYKSFGLPSIGRLYRYIEPTHLAGVRCDSGIEEGSEISVYYDPMICKLVCYGKDRKESIERSIKALDYYVIRGVIHNIPLLRDILTEQKFNKGDISTNYLPQVYPDGFKGKQLDVKDKQKLLAMACSLFATNDLRNRQFLNVPQVKIDKKPAEEWKLYVELNEEKYKLDVTQSNGEFKINVNDEEYVIRKEDIDLAKPLLEVKVNDETDVIQLLSKDASGYYQIIYQGTTYKLFILTQRSAEYLHLMPEKIKFDVSKQIRSPMPGLVKSVNCNVGDEVVEGQELCVIEAMKMQNSMVATSSGKVRCVNIHPGDTVGDDDILIELA
ncbi:unnamed protein product [Acanthoscelides obtectus]|nr:unnamed protein product [Acanthoscelides obtectus]CAK1676895.1 Propionyl-CoA carboxylase alpha chain, mitochondrial [Acanthoscelides obtectus]